MINEALFFCVFPILLFLTVPVTGAEDDSKSPIQKAVLVYSEKGKTTSRAVLTDYQIGG